MDSIAEYDPTHYLLHITHHPSHIFNRRGIIVFATKCTKEAQKTQRNDRFEINDCTVRLMLIFLKDLIDHQLGWRGLKEDFNRRLKFLLIGYLWIKLLNMIPP